MDNTETKKNKNFKHNNPFQITSTKNSSDHFFKLESPFQITLEYCDGIEDNDYMNIVTLSTKKIYFYQQPYSTQSQVYHHQPMHVHDYFELMMVLDGSIVQRIEGKEYTYHAGSCCLVNRSLRHTENFLSQSYILFIGISVELMMEILDSAKYAFFDAEKAVQSYNLLQFINSDITNPGIKAYLDYIPTYHNQKNHSQLHHFAEIMIDAMLNPKFGATYKIKELICSLIERLSSPDYYHCSYITMDYQADYLLFSRISHLLKENNGRISRAKLEQLLHYSGDYLNKVVNKYTNMCIFDYGMTFCLQKAENLLTTTTLPITEIAEQLEFSNRTHFYTQFKKKYGMTPNEYRKQH